MNSAKAEPVLIGYASDERYVALCDVLLEFERGESSVEVRSLANGAVVADLPPGEYLVTLQKEGFGGKRVRMQVGDREPYHFRLLSEKLLGYMWPKWVRAGESAEFRVHAPEAYKLELWRYGARKELVAPLGWFDEHGPRPEVQLTPDGDYTQTGVRWNGRGYRLGQHPRTIAAPERSGLYFVHAKSESGEFFSFPWVVAPERPRSSIAVLASNITWNSYNSFGGRSNYINPDRLPPEPTVSARQDLRRYTDPQFMGYESDTYLPLSFDRPEPMNFVPEHEEPLDPVEGRIACGVAPAEWRLLAWLEREGFDYDYYAETQFDAGLLDLNDYRVLVLSVHPEYWTAGMYERLKRWVFEGGGRLVYLGGNGLNCEVELVDSHGVVHHNGRYEELLRSGAESRFHLRRESEANLLGVVFTDTGIMTGAPYRVLDETHWCFTETGLKNGDLFGRNSQHQRCPGGASGHEQDKRSPSSPPNARLLAKGLNPQEGGAEIVHFGTPAGGEVFSVGSINWPCSVLVDEDVSQITKNVLRRFLE